MHGDRVGKESDEQSKLDQRDEDDAEESEDSDLDSEKEPTDEDFETPIEDDDFISEDDSEEMVLPEEELTPKEQDARSLAIRRAIEQRMEQKKLDEDLDYLDLDQDEC